MIAGKPMIVRTYLQAKKASKLTRLVVATDDIRIKEACEAVGAEVSHKPGTLNLKTLNPAP
jgi:3-deoxy-manno-octulosonate cytidylyltransferase (CMP-KDO synthetase)